MDAFFTVIGNLGFPIAVTGFLLLRVEKKLDELNSTLVHLVEKLVDKKNKED